MAAIDNSSSPVTRPISAGEDWQHGHMPHTDSLPAQLLRKGFPWLRFPAALERLYNEDHRAAAHGRVRMAIIVAGITSLGFFIIDQRVIGAVNAVPDIVRFSLQLPALLFCLLATSRRFYLRWYQPCILVGLPLFGLGTVVMTAYAPPDHTPLVGARLLLVAFFCYFMLGLRLRQALACNAIVFGFLVAIGLLELIPNEIAWYLSFAMLCANAIGAVGAYALEHASRTAFLERLSLEEMAARDGLTRLLNRQAFEFRARNAWRNATTMQRAVAVVMVDVDYFKRFNDQYGHQAGDDCLRRVAACVRDAIAPERDELVARYGGEELIALLVGRTPVDVEAVAQRIVDSVAELRIPHQASVVCEHVSVSVGACQPTSDATIPFATLAHTADQALYLAKHQGRNRSVSIDASGAFDRQSSADEGVTRPEARALLRSENEEIGRAAAPA